MNELNELGQIIFLERYAKKDREKNVDIGDTLVYKQGHQKTFGVVRQILNGNALVLGNDGETKEVRIIETDRLLETVPQEMFDRVSSFISNVEIDKDFWAKQFSDLMQNWKFVPAGRILAGMGVDGLSAYNCFVTPSPIDSREGIMETLGQMIEIMSRGGGVGINLSTLRPRYAFVKGVNGRSSGAVSWGGIYSYATGLVEQGGCVAGDTLIATSEGSFKIKDLVGKTPTVYSCDIDNSLVAQRKAKWVDKTGTKETIVITTNLNFKLVLTKDHLVLTTDGIYVAAAMLGIGARLMSVPNVTQVVTSIDPGELIDVYDMEVPGFNNFLVESEGSSVFISNSRRGALMLMLADWHPDIEEFIDAKREAGKITNANISVTISDQFMQAVKNDGDWQLRFPDTTSEHYSKWNGDIKAWDENGYPTIIYKTIKAKDLYNKIVTSAWASAEPGVAFIDRANNMSNSWYFDRLVATNPCFSANANLLTPMGLTTAGRAKVGDTIWSGNRWTIITNKSYSGYKQVNRYETSYGYFLGTENHKVLQNGEKVEVKEAESIDVSPGERFSFDNENINPQHIMDGLLIGDGSYHKAGKQMCLVIGENDQDYFQSNVSKLIKKQYRKPTWYSVETTISYLPRTYKRTVPDEYFYGSFDKTVGFLRGLFSANGSVIGEEACRVTLKQTSYILIRQVQSMLSSLGIRSRITVNKAKTVKFSTGEYECKESYDLNISSDRMIFKELIGFIQIYKMNKIIGATKDLTKTSNIQNVVAIGMEDVWDITVADEEHTVWTNGLVVANCGEQFLPGNGVCNLSAINLPKYISSGGEILWDELYYDVQTAVRFLDDVIDATPYFTEEIKAQQLKERRVGLNTMGLAEMFIKLGIKYGSDGSLQFIKKLYKHIVKAAYFASSMIAKEKGSFPAFDADKFLESGYMKNMIKEIPELEKLIKENGMRNVTLLTQAPNGSTGTMVDTSTGIEPFFAFEFQRTSRLGKFTQRVQVADEWLKNHPGKELPDYFVTAMQLTPREHIEVLSAIQYWIDSAISKTSNLPNDYTIEQVAELYQLMYDMGAKGGTIYRDGSRSEQVLEVKKDVDVRIEVDIVETSTKLPTIRMGQTTSIPTHFGTLHLTMNVDENEEPVEVFINVGKAGSDLMALAESIGRLISYALQVPSSRPRIERYNQIVKQLQGIGGGQSYGFGPNKISSFPDAVSSAMKFTGINEAKEVSTTRDLCPECGSISMIREEGCSKCTNCGYSKC